MQSTNSLPSIDADILAPTPLPTNGPVVVQNDAEKTDSESGKAPEAKSESEKPDKKKRFIPEHKKPDSALTFPEKVCPVLFHNIREPCRLIG
jgi:hypothetical protein